MDLDVEALGIGVLAAFFVAGRFDVASLVAVDPDALSFSTIAGAVSAFFTSGRYGGRGAIFALPLSAMGFMPRAGGGGGGGFL